MLCKIIFLIFLASAECYYGSVDEMKAFIDEQNQAETLAASSSLTLLLDLKDKKTSEEFFNQTEIDEIDKLIEEAEEEKNEIEAAEIEEIEEMNVFSRQTPTGGNKVLICYYGSWATYRTGNGKLDVDDIDPHLCTHLVYGFAGLDKNELTVKSLDPWNDLGSGGGKRSFRRFTDLKKKNPSLKTLIGIGGWNEKSDSFSKMARTKATRTKFINSVMKMVEKYNFDGVDMDWEYPTKRGGQPVDKEKFQKLLSELNQQLKSKGRLLTAAVSAGSVTVKSAYDVKALSDNVDYINLMSYDFHGSWESKTGHNSPLFSRPEEEKNDARLNMNYAVNYWLKKGADKNKLVLGIATYGRTFTLQDTNNHKVLSPTKGPGKEGPYTQQPGALGYNEFCESLGRWTVVQDRKSKVPYAYKNSQWFTFDDIESVKIKANYANEMNLAGAMIFALETDDSKGVCNNGKFPLISTVKANLNGLISPDSLPEKRPNRVPKRKPNRTNKKCKELFNNTCIKNSDCCSKYCFKQKDWALGVCKNRE